MASVCALFAAAARLSSIHSTIRALAFSLRMVEYRGVSVGVMSVMQMFAMGRYAMTASLLTIPSQFRPSLHPLWELCRCLAISTSISGWSLNLPLTRLGC